MHANSPQDLALSQTLVRLSRRDAFFSNLAVHLNPRFTDAPWLATACTDGEEVLMNPRYFLGLDAPEQLALLKHEVMHVAFEHVFRRGARHHVRWNIACDYVINLLIKEDGDVLPPNGLYDEQYTGMVEEEVYAKLPAGIEKRFDVALLGDLRAAPSKHAHASSDAQRQRVRGIILQSAQAAHMMGALSADIARYLRKILQPEQDWRALLAEYLTALAKSDYDWMRPNRRSSVLNVILPGMNQVGALEHVAIVADTSGSISTAALGRFIGEILAVVEVCYPQQITVIPCDAEVYSPVFFETPPDVGEIMEKLSTQDALQGGGGTNMPRALDWIDERLIQQELNPPPAVVLVMTDGCTRFGAARDYPVIWCITASEKDVPNPEWGRVVRLQDGGSIT
ncbi:hypothetical protein AGMMS49545_02180 [Betaproteobacteria bacterium]|nr:hypothetical protein AGMMS49545_02180 [Betaproteobacteria bacterium]GHU43823.1 hypothetical protein AGMMS50289_10930 [Betaproteobacteria bacterium]